MKFGISSRWLMSLAAVVIGVSSLGCAPPADEGQGTTTHTTDPTSTTTMFPPSTTTTP